VAAPDWSLLVGGCVALHGADGGRHRQASEDQRHDEPDDALPGHELSIADEYPRHGVPQYGMAKAEGKRPARPTRRAARRPGSSPGWGGAKTRRLEYEAGATVFRQGDPATTVLYVERGAVRLAVLSHAGKEAVVALLESGHFFGEGCLAGQPQRMGTATAMVKTTVLSVQKDEMVRRLQAQPAFAERFLTHMLTRNIRIEEDLIDQLFNSSEKRLARTLLLLARYGQPEASHRTLPKVSQGVLAEMIGTTRSRVNFFMNKFRKLGFIDYNGTLKVNNSLLTVVLRD
jgi:CRP/FNR family cyclic AMP-dependent transcriptional regulator